MRRVVVAALLVAIGTLGAVSPASARNDPHLKVTPNTGITNREKLKVAGRRLEMDHPAEIYECDSQVFISMSGGLIHCTPLKELNANNVGAIHGIVRAIVGPVGTAGGTCDATHQCILAAYSYAASQTPVWAWISFA